MPQGRMPLSGAHPAHEWNDRNASDGHRAPDSSLSHMQRQQLLVARTSAPLLHQRIEKCVAPDLRAPDPVHPGNAAGRNNASFFLKVRPHELQTHSPIQPVIRRNPKPMVSYACPTAGSNVTCFRALTTSPQKSNKIVRFCRHALFPQTFSDSRVCEGGK